MQSLAEHLIDSPNEFNKVNNTGAQMQDSIHHKTLKSHLNHDCHIKIVKIWSSENVTFLWRLTHNVKKLIKIHVICLFNPLVDYRF